MKQALSLAENAFTRGEVPVGAVVVKNGKIIGRGSNQNQSLNDPTAHAELIAITAAANTLNDWRLEGCVLIVTKEPCAMCAGAIMNARLAMVVFGCYDEEKGCCGSLYQLCGDRRFGKPIPVRGGILEEQCSALISEFFQKQRTS